MPIVPEEEIKRIKEETNTIKEVTGGFKGPHLPHVYDNRSECLRENIKEAERLRLAREGKDMDMRTPKQVKEAAERATVLLERQQKAALAAEIALQNK